MPTVVVLHFFLGALLPLDARVDGLVDPGALLRRHRVVEVRLAQLLALLVHKPLIREGIAK